MKDDQHFSTSGLRISDRSFNVALTVIYIAAILGTVFYAAASRPHFYLGAPSEHSDSMFGQWLTLAVVVGVIGGALFARYCGSSPRRLIRLIRLTAARLSFWLICIGPLLIAAACFTDACLAHKTIDAAAYRFECLLLLLVGVSLQWTFRSVIGKSAV